MQKLLKLALVAVVMSGCSSSRMPGGMQADNALTKQEQKEGYQLLFDGQTTNGWHTYGYDKVGAGYRVDSGTLHLNVSDMSSWPRNESKDILTNEEYENFHFKGDWKIAPGGNSGIIFYVNENKPKYRNTYQTGLEMQVIDNEGHRDAKIVKHRAGDLYDLISSSSEPVKPANQWNHVEIISDHGKLDFYMNGEHIVSTTLWDDNWKQMVANSKFKTMPDFGTFHKGHIALQEHGEEVWFKNLKIKRL